MVEVNRPDHRQHRAQGKSDPLDAYAGADALPAGRARALPKDSDKTAESIRTLHLTSAGAIKARTAAIDERRALLITTPAALREHLTGQPATVIAQRDQWRGEVERGSVDNVGRRRPATV